MAAARRRTAPMPWLKLGIFLGGLVPLASVVVRGLDGSLSANPIAEAENELGLAALVFLVAALGCTPARQLWGWTWPARVRRELGLFAFFYASVHFATYLFLDRAIDLGSVLDDVVERPFITAGFAALVLLTPLAITSTSGWVKRLGYRHWQRLHRLVYLAGGLAALHFIWRVKVDLSQPAVYATAIAVLLLVRLAFRLWKPRARARATA